MIIFIFGTTSCEMSLEHTKEKVVPKYKELRHLLKKTVIQPFIETKHWIKKKFSHHHHHHHKSATPATASIAAATTLENNQKIKNYDDYQRESRQLTQVSFDTIPTAAQGNPQFIFKDPPLGFDFSKIKRPSTSEISSFNKKYPVVRPVPFPYYSIFSIPSDACGSNMADLYYSEALFQRKYGLDLTNSFFVVSDYLIGAPNSVSAPSFISNTAVKPLSHPVQVNNEIIDNLPAFLTYFYRGWIDHLHGWTTEGTSFIPLLEPKVVQGNETGNKQDLTVNAASVTKFDGFELDFQTQGNVKAWVLRIRDMDGLDHFIAVGTKLAKDQQGWEFTLPKDHKNIHLYAALETEKNKHAFNQLGQPIAKQAYLQNADMLVYGTVGSHVELKMIRQVPFDRQTVAKQMNLMQQYNIFPIFSSYHGGSSSWYQESPGLDLAVEYNGKKYNVLRPSMATTVNSPTYVSNLFNNFGICYRGLLHLLEYIPVSTAKMAEIKILDQDVHAYYITRHLPTDPSLPSLLTSPHTEHAENLGPVIADYILKLNDFGLIRPLYTHFNYYNKDAFSKLPPDFASGAVQMMELKKLPPSTESALISLAELKYNRTGHIEPHQRIWVPSISAASRYVTVLTQLQNHTTVKGNSVYIQSWIDSVSGRKTPDMENPTLDLHGQTFYVPNAATATIYLDGKLLPTLKRNPKDITGRESVTVVDLTHPKLFFGQLDPIENHYARIDHKGASLFYQANYSTPGKYTLQVASERNGLASVAIKPYLFDSYETDFFHFIVKTSRPDLQFFIGWKGAEDHFFAATNGAMPTQSSVWTLPSYNDTRYHDYVFDYSDLKYTKNAPLARGPVNEVQVGMLNAKPGDTVTIERIEFLAASGIKAEQGGYVLGGRVLPGIDHVPVKIVYNGQQQKTWTERGGWYFFKKIPKNAIVEITADYKGLSFTPVRGRLLQAHRNDVEYHINVADLRANSVPRPNLTNMTTQPSMLKSAVDARPHASWFYAGSKVGTPLSYLAEDSTNNFGYIDKDRRVENVDHTYRILLLAYDLEQGKQTPNFQHMNLLLESMLRQKLQRNVEVIMAAIANTSIAAHWDTLEKYGQQFKPDLVLLMNNPSNMFALEPSLQQQTLGFNHQHPPFVLFDFDKEGNLQKTDSDPLYNKYVSTPSMTALNGYVPLSQSYVTPEVGISLVERSYQLLEAILAEKYVPLVKSWGGKVALVYGYYPLDYPSNGTDGSNYIRTEEFAERMQEICNKAAISCLDLTNEAYRSDYKEVATWEIDKHLTPTGHYLLAQELTSKLLPLIDKNKVTSGVYATNE